MRLWVDADYNPPRNAPGGAFHDHARSFGEATAIMESGKVSYISIGVAMREREPKEFLFWLHRSGIWPRDGIYIHSPRTAPGWNELLTALQQVRR